MNRRAVLSLSLLAPVAGVMAARDVMATPIPRVWASSGTITIGEYLHGDAFIGESVGESRFITPNQARKILSVPDELFGADDTTNRNLKSWSRPAEDESVSAQFESDLAFLRDAPGVVI